MKILISLIFCLSTYCFASAGSLVEPHQRAEFLSTLMEFELLPNQVLEKRRRSRGRRSTTDIQDLLRGLNEDLSEGYLSKAQEKLGFCTPAPCLTRDSFGASTFRDGEEKDHCYPGTNCEYYRCMEQQYRCLDVGVEYFAKLAKPTCEAYVKNIKAGKFTAKGNEWIYTVMVCLQKGLFEECSLRGNCPESESNQKTCEHITEFTLKFHPGCYINSGVGVCKLPLKDQVNIWRTVGPFLTDRERVEAYKVVRYCLFNTPIE